MSQQKEIPSSILVVGSGVFGLTALYELLQRPSYSSTNFILLSSALPEAPQADTADPRRNRDLTASVDSTRIIRSDYADPLYAELCRQAIIGWKSAWGANGRYSQNGLLLTGESGPSGADYIAKSLVNVKDASTVGCIHELSCPADVAKAMRAEGAVGSGQGGYINDQSGWADAGACMDWLFGQVEAVSRGRLRTVNASAAQVLTATNGHGGTVVTGVLTESGEQIRADQTVLATGAWTPALVDCSGLASARGQSVAYFDLTEDEARALQVLPVHFNMTSGCFLFPPTQRASDGGWEIKVAIHGYGYMGPQHDVNVLGDDGRVHQQKARLPSFPDRLPPKDHEKLLEFLNTTLPRLGSVWEAARRGERRVGARICWYLDTAVGDFLVCDHPSFNRTLFLATGGSGHAFKMTPALGRHIVDVMDGTDVRDRGGVWTNKWRWPERAVESEVWCQDGSRGGVPGVALQDALERKESRESQL